MQTTDQPANAGGADVRPTDFPAFDDSGWVPDPSLGDTPPRTTDDLLADRDETTSRLDATSRLAGWPGFDWRFTCDTCALVRVCGLAFDPYNTDGDCLRAK